MNFFRSVHPAELCSVSGIIKIFPLLILFLFFSSFLKSEENPPILDEILVTATRISDKEIPLEKYPGYNHVILGDSIYQKTTNNLSHSFESIEGMNITDLSGFGMGSGLGSMINLRGIGCGEKMGALILLNGVPLHQLTNNAVPLKAIPLNDIDRIEILKGAGNGVIYGQGALAGVINIVSKKPKEKFSIETSSSFGSFGQNNYLLNMNQKINNLGYDVSFNQEFLGGYREHSAYEGTSGSLRLTWDLDTANNFDLYILSHTNTTESPGPLTPEQVKENRTQQGSFAGTYYNEFHLASLTYLKKIDDFFSYNIQGYHTWRDNDSDFGSGLYEIENPSTGANFNFNFSHPFNDNNENTIILGTELSQKQASTGLKNTQKSESDVQEFGIYTQDILCLKEIFIIETGYRFDKAIYDEDLTWPTYQGKLRFDGHSFKTGISYHMNDYFTPFISAAKTFKLPAIDDIDAVTPSFNDNADIKPQEAYTYESGINWAFSDWLNGKGSVFMTMIKREILYNPYSFKNENFDTKHPGAEWALKANITKKITYGLNGTYMNATFDGGQFDGKRIPLTPRHIYHTDLSYKILKNWNVSLDWMFIINQYRGNDLENNFKAKDYDVLNANINYEKENFSCYVAINNLLDEKYSTYQGSTIDWFTGSPIIGSGENSMPGINFIAGIKIKI